MSITLMSAAWQIDLPASDKLVLLALADCANDEGSCWPSMATLVKKCSKGERTVQASIKSLVKLGHITRDERPGKGCLYTVHPRNNCAPAKSAPPQKLTPTPAESADKPSRTIIVEEAKASPTKRAKPEQVEIPDWIPAEPWAGFVAMRKEQGKPLKGRALTLAITELRKLADAGHPPGAVLDQSTLKSWLGLFPIKDQRNGQQQQPGSRTAGAVAAVMERMGDRATSGAAIADRRSDRPAPSLPSPVRPGWNEPGRAR